MSRSNFLKFAPVHPELRESTQIRQLPIFLRSARLQSLFALLVVVDQLSKWLVVEAGQFVQLNQGISFGLLANHYTELSGVVLFAVMIGLYYAFAQLWQKHSRWAAVFFAGALSNSIDRFLVGGVRDWLPIPLTSLYNNLADWFITVALISIVLTEVHQYFSERTLQKT
jgi:lipoprotein signal peptidase